jgi:hypothetical protein
MRGTTTRAATAAFTLVALLCAAEECAAAEDLTGLLRDAARAQQSGRLQEAAALFDRAHAAFPQDVTAARGSCEAGLALAESSPLSRNAVDSCYQAYVLTHVPRDTRNRVAALLKEKAIPDLDVVALASLGAEAALKQAPEQVWGHLARYDLARRLGRADLLAASRIDLEPFASTEPAALEALNDRLGRPPAWVWLLRILVLSGLAATGLHAFASRRRRASPSKEALPSRKVAILLGFFSLAVSSTAWSVEPPAAAPNLNDDEKPVVKDDQISSFKIDDAHPEVAVQTLLAKTNDPLQLGYLLQDLAVRADAANGKGDNARAARYYHALGVAAPTPYGPRMECKAREAIGDIPGAILACRELLTRNGVVVDDHVHFVELVLKSTQPLPALEQKELEGVIAHLEKETKLGDLPAFLRCKVALRFDDGAGLDACESALKSAPVDDPRVIAIKWGLAVREHDKAGALALVEQARKAGASADNISRMVQTTNAMATRRLQKTAVIGALGILLLGAAFFGARMLASSRRRSTSRSAA